MPLLPKDNQNSNTSSTDPSARPTVNTGLAIVGPYSAAASGAANYGGVAGDTSKEFLTFLHHYRIRQCGTISRIKLYVDNKTNLTAFYFKVWRKNSGGTYDLVGISENIINSLSAGQINTVDLSLPIKAQEGDYYGYRMEWSDGVSNLYARTGLQTASNGSINNNNKTFYVTNTTPITSGYAWESQPSDLGYAVPIEMYMAPPILVAIGDSHVSGGYSHMTYIKDYVTAFPTAPENIKVTFPYILARHWNFTYQNMGYSGQTTNEISSRFNADVVALRPKFALLEGGTNDIPLGVTETTFYNNWKTMLDACANNSIKAIVMLIPPRTDYTNAQHQERDRWNRQLTILASEYPNVIVVDFDRYIGVNRAGGDSGNMWNIATAYRYSGDSVHFNEAGMWEIANTILKIVDYWKKTL